MMNKENNNNKYFILSLCFFYSYKKYFEGGMYV